MTPPRVKSTGKAAPKATLTSTVSRASGHSASAVHPAQNAAHPAAAHPGPEDTRERLITVATALFAQRGFDGVSVKELADEAGVNVSLISYHFGGKENLYRTCLEQFGKERLAAAQRTLQSPHTVEELRFRMTLFIEEMFACHLDCRDTIELIHRECEMEVPLAPDVFRDTFLKVFETLIEFFKSGQAAGVVNKKLDPTIVAHLIFGSIKNIMHSDHLNSKFFGRTITDETYRRKVVEHIIQCNVFGISEERSKS